MTTEENNFQALSATQEDRINKAASRIVLRHTFFASMLLSLKRVPVKWAPTMCTDGVHIFWSPEFAASCSDDQLAGVLVHEVLHPALGHLWRTKKEWDHNVANQAADYAINNFLDAYNRGNGHRGAKLPLPEGALIDHKYDDLSFEQIYLQLIREQEDPDKQDGEGEPGEGEPGEGGGSGSSSGYISDGEFMAPGAAEGEEDEDADYTEAPPSAVDPTKQLTQADWVNRLETAKQAARAMGNMPGALDRLLGGLSKAEVDWVARLAQFLNQITNDDYDWSYPDRRYMQAGFYIPDMRNEACGPMAVIFDTSGSVDDALLRRFAGELQDIMVRARPESVRVIYCDSVVQHVEEFKPGDQLVLHPKGGGGTDFRPALNLVTKTMEDVSAAIYFTDGYGSFPTAPPDFPVMWVDYGAGVNFPFGEVVKVNL